MKLLVIEDERRVRSFISRALRESSYLVDTVDTGEHALEVAATGRYDGILLDIRLPGMNGIDICRELRRARIETPILMVSARSLVEERVAGLDAGADDYLTKPFAIAELLARVRALVRRRTGKLGATLRFDELEFDRHRHIASRRGSKLSLTSKELEVLEFLLTRAPEVSPRTEIIEHVWGYDFESETNLLEVYINRLRKKIGAPSLIHTVHGVGYCLRKEA